MNEKILTLIVPTYNMEEYLDKCLTSLIMEDRGKMEQLEVLVIIDGATDRSAEIAHKYEEQFSYTYRVIEKRNGNYGSCINRGLEEAGGKYVKILDADDWFDTKVLEGYISFLNNQTAYIIINRAQSIDKFGKVIQEVGKLEDKVRSVKSLDTLDESFGANIRMHNIAYRREIFKEWDYHQTEGIFYTDNEWVAVPMTRCKTIVFFDGVLYQYYIGREGRSMDFLILENRIKDIMLIGIKLLETYTYYNVNKGVKGILLGVLKQHIASMYNYSGILSNAEEFDKLESYIYSSNKELYDDMKLWTLKNRNLYYVPSRTHLWKVLFSILKTKGIKCAFYAFCEAFNYGFIIKSNWFFRYWFAMKQCVKKTILPKRE
ncbi:MAG TPA: hypothetical protein DDY68_06210 [Porphyromonadaceae bacterium]|nr:hypothetical protein [Porphyromonadaceae bacterium]